MKYELKKAKYRTAATIRDIRSAGKVISASEGRYTGNSFLVRLDMIRCSLLYGCSPAEYFRYRFEDKSGKERSGYVTGTALRMTVRDQNRNAVSDKVLKDKYALYQTIPQYFKRDVVLVRNGQDMTEVRDFLKKHRSFIMKPRNKNYGEGIRIVRLDTSDTDTLPEELLNLDDEYILEELIVQDEALACFHPQSVNTMRVASCFRDGKTNLLFTMLRMGCGESSVDNTSTGGIFAVADRETGVIISKGCRRNGEIHDAHPDTGVPFIGYQIPKWDEMVKMTDEMAHIFPDLRLIGWDLALSDKGWVVVEGNNGPGFNGPQICLDHGIKKEAEQLLGMKIR